MLALCAIMIFIGIILLTISFIAELKDHSMRIGAFLFMVAGMIAGCLGTPSRDMPNGMPGTGLISCVIILIGIFFVVKPYIPQIVVLIKKIKEIQISENWKRKIIIISSAVIVLTLMIIGFSIYWNATEDDRYIKSEMEYVLEQVEAYRSGENSDIEFYVASSVLDDWEFIDFLSVQASEMIDNGEYDLLFEFLTELRRNDACISEIQDNVKNMFESIEDLEIALEIKEKYSVDYYEPVLSFRRDSKLFSSYIKSNGIEEITTTPGTGFYANEKDDISTDWIGLEGSPIHDSKSLTYMGDFKILEEYGVTLDKYYNETYYSYDNYYFCDQPIDFSPMDGECIYSGNYLFCFDSDGTLIGCEKIDEK